MMTNRRDAGLLGLRVFNGRPEAASASGPRPLLLPGGFTPISGNPTPLLIVNGFRFNVSAWLTRPRDQPDAVRHPSGIYLAFGDVC